MEKPTNKNVSNVKRGIRYLKGTQGIEFHGNYEINEMTAYSDSDFAGDTETP